MYRKFTASHFFNGYEILESSPVLITDASGTIVDVVERAAAGEDITFFNGLLSPGFVNAHCHLELSHMKGIIPEKTGLVGFVQQVMSLRSAPGEEKMAAMKNAEAEMYGSGIVAVGDICNTADSIAIKKESRLLWHNFIEVSGFTDAAAEKRLADMKKVYDQFRSELPGQITTLSPHAPYSVSKKMFQLLNEETAGQLITLHNQEAAAENELYNNKSGDFLRLYKNFGIDISAFSPTGKSSFQSWLPYFNRQQSIIVVHNSFTGTDDLVFANDHFPPAGGEIFYCICLYANRYIEQIVPPLLLLKNNNSTIVLGTDSYASNTQLNILEEIKAIQQATEYVLPLGEVLRWATSNGARALRMDHMIGSFEKGKKPGIVLLEGLENLQTTASSSAKRIL